MTETAIAALRQSAEQGDANAQYRLAIMYYKGLGVAQDPGQALEWCGKAASQGHPDARFLLDGIKSRATPARPVQPAQPAQASQPVQRARPAREPVRFPDLQPISKAPSLWTLNGVGFKLYGHSDYDPETDSYVSTHYLVILFLPVMPTGRYRVIREGNLYHFLGKEPLRLFDKLHIAAFALLCLSALFTGKHH